VPTGVIGNYSVVISDPGVPSVLVLDNDPDIRSRLDRLLLLEGFTPIHAANAAAAIVAAGERQVDAFILDRKLLDGQPGLEVLAWVRRHPAYRVAPVFVLTGTAQIDEIDRQMIKHHWAFVFHKGHPLEVLMEYIKRVLGGLHRLRGASQRAST
jgi:DNA-binding response OmpR family regulator